jgi:hypothetical protein
MLVKLRWIEGCNTGHLANLFQIEEQTVKWYVRDFRRNPHKFLKLELSEIELAAVRKGMMEEFGYAKVV